MYLRRFQRFNLHQFDFKFFQTVTTLRALAVRTPPAGPLQRPPATDRTDCSTLRR